MTGVDARITATINDVRDATHQLHALQLVATMPTLDGQAIIDYRPGDWLKITLHDPYRAERAFLLPPDWGGP